MSRVLTERAAMFCAAVFLVNGTAFGQSLPSPTVSETSTKISAHVFMTAGFPNIVYVVGDAATLVIDTGLGNANGATAARVAKKLAKGPKLFLTSTQYHWEHAGGVGGFPPETILIRSAAQQREMDRDLEQMAVSFRRSPSFGPYMQGLGTLRPADVTFDTEATLDLGGGVKARLMFLGAGHTDSDELVLVEPDQALVSGDIVQNKTVPTVPTPGGGFASWLRVLDKVALLKPAIIVPTHSKVGDASLIVEETAFIRHMLDRVTALKRSGVSVEDAATRLTDEFKANYPDWVANRDWPNVSQMTPMVNRMYGEIP